MVRRPSTPESSIESMCDNWARTRSMEPSTLKFYRQTLRSVLKRLDAAGCRTFPWEIEEEDVVTFIEAMETDKLTVSTKKGYLFALRQWCSHYGNDIPKTMRIRMPADMRPNADWLSLDEAKALLGAAVKDPVDELLVHCELCLGMRRAEVVRLKVDSFSSGWYVDIVGKGSFGGKPRRVPYHRDTAAVLERYMTYRGQIVKEAMGKKPSTREPRALLIWEKAGRLSGYSLKGTGIDKRLRALGEIIGCPKLSSHTLRRSFGRFMFRSGVTIEQISKMLGHDDIGVTQKYLGLDMDDMESAMSEYML